MKKGQLHFNLKYNYDRGKKYITIIYAKHKNFDAILQLCLDK